ncbi:MAG: transporter associated domain-containing protein, partial [Alphaproteobacteria bacterium]
PVARGRGVALAQSEPAVSRVELDLPGQLGREMVGYPIRTDSAVLARDTLPDGARLVLVVRDGAVLEPSAAGSLAAGDYAYILADSERIHRLDRLFAEGGAAWPTEDEFGVNGAAPIGALAELYGLAVTAEERGLTVSEVFAARLDDTPRPGDAIELDRVTLAVRAVDGGRVTRAALLLPDVPPMEVGVLRVRHAILDAGHRLAGLGRRLRGAVRRPTSG